jgi:hypothetical protein
MYHDLTLSMTSTSGATTRYFYSANGLYDPDITGTGHQPMGFDQLMARYNQYTVVNSKLTVQFFNNSAAYDRVAISLRADTTATSDKITIVENTNLVTTILNPNIMSGNSKELSLNCSVATYFGRKTDEVIVNDPDLLGNAAGNPVEQCYYALNAWDPFTAQTITTYFNVTIEYDAIFWEPKVLITS